MQAKTVFASSALGVALCLVSSTAVLAQTFSGAASNVIYQTGGLPLSPLVNSDQTLCFAASISGSCGIAGADFQASGTGGVGGVFHASAYVSASNVDVALRSSPSNVSAIGLAAYAYAGVMNDTITFAGVVPSYLTFSYVVDGAVTTTAGPNSSVLLTPDVNVAFGYSSLGQAPLASFILDRNFSTTGSTYQPFYATGSVVTPLGGGNQITFSTQFVSDVLITDPTGTGLSGSVLSDFSNTAAFGVRAFDANGTDITSSAGMQFSALALPAAPSIPEPATWAMMLMGLGGLGAAMRVRRKPVAD